MALHSMVRKARFFVARDGKIKSDPEDILNEPLRSGDVQLYQSDNHFQNWVDCIRSRELPVADIEIGHRSATVCHIANICGRLKRRLEWDPEAEVFVNDSGANEMLDREERKGYEYKA